MANALQIKAECEISGEITEMNEISHRKGEHSPDTVDGVFIEYSVSTGTLSTDS